jgi:hypothetical protein
MRQRRYAVAAAVAGLSCALAAVLATLLAGDGASVPAPDGEAAVYRASIEPQRFFVGDPFVAELEVTVNRALVVPETVRSGPDFSPFRQLGPTEVTRRDVGETTVLTYRYRLQCVDRACVPGGEERVFELPLSVFNYADPQFGAVTESVDWPALTVVSRLAPGELEDPVLEVSAGPPPAVSYAVGPNVLGWLFTGIGAAVALSVGALLARRLWRAAPARPEETQLEPAGSPLVHAVGLLEAVLGGAEEERRTALDGLARALDVAGYGELARRARSLAWSRPAPGVAEASEFAAGARRLIGEAV